VITKPHDVAEMPSLLDLPVELLVEVAKQASIKDLCALRLVCRDLAAAIFETYASTCFSVRTHLSTSRGMQMFAEVTAHEKYAKCIKNITLVAPGLDPGKYNIIALDPESTPDEYCSQMDRKYARINFEEEQSDAKRPGSIAIFLLQALNNLRIARASPSIEVCDFIPTGRPCCGLADFRDTLEMDVPSLDLSWGSCDSLYPIVLNALMATELVIGSLSISALHPMKDPPFDFPRLTSPNAGLRDLRWLKLGFGPSLEGWNFDRSDHHCHLFDASNLEHISISLEQWPTYSHTLYTEELLSRFAYFIEEH